MARQAYCPHRLALGSNLTMTGVNSAPIRRVKYRCAVMPIILFLITDEVRRRAMISMKATMPYFLKDEETAGTNIL